MSEFGEWLKTVLAWHYFSFMSVMPFVNRGMYSHAAENCKMILFAKRVF